MLFEFVDHVDESVGNISVGGVVLGLVQSKGSSGVIVRSGIILGPFGISVLSLGQLVESFHGFVVEQVGIGGQFVDGSLDLGELNGLSGVFFDDSDDVFSQHLDDLQSFVVFL